MGAVGSTPEQCGVGAQLPRWLMALASLPHSLPRGKFGEVHTCTEKQTGLKLAAKVIRKQGAKDKVCPGWDRAGGSSWPRSGWRVAASLSGAVTACPCPRTGG